MKTHNRSLSIRLAAIAASLVLIAAMVLGYYQTSYAADASYGTNSFDVHVVAHENNSFDVQENIVVDFWYPHHGIYRYIPNNGVTLSNISVPGYYYESYYDGGNLVLQIGDGNYTLMGPNKYQINYRMTAYDDKDESVDRLMLNVIPTGWETEIEHATATIELPKKADLSNIQLYTGSAWSEDNAVDAVAKGSADGKTITVDAYNVPANNGITVIVELPEGYWTGEREIGALTPWALFLLLLGPVAAAIIWFIFGRDKHMVKTLEFYPPNDLTPGEIGYIIDESADKCDIVSSIIYLANKGYLSIEEYGNNDYKFTKLREIGNEPEYIKDIYHGIFSGREVAINSELGTKFGAKYLEAIEDLQSMFASEKRQVYSMASRIARLVNIALAAMPMIAFTAWESHSGTYYGPIEKLLFSICLWAAAYCVCSAVDKIHSAKKSRTVIRILLTGLWMELGLGMPIASSQTMSMVGGTTAMAYKLCLLLAEGIIIFFAAISMARKAEYTDLMGKILGFKDFIRTAELDKLKELVEEDPSYFYNVLPYAYVFGLTDKWIKNFEHIEIPRPDWYCGTRFTYFDAYLMGRMMSNCSAGVANHIRYPVNTSSSGISKSDWFRGGSGGGFSSGGGGFSGGGFGGGGGGAW